MIVFIAGLAGLLLLAALLPKPPAEPPTVDPVDLAAPYQEGLLAAARLQQTSLELEQQICAEAVRHAKAAPTLPPPIRYSPGTSSCTTSKN